MNDAQSDAAPHIAGYEISGRLGRGGMADVYLAMQISLSRPVAIKVLAVERTQGEDVVTRFEHEARTIARLDHPHIVSIFDVGHTDDGRLYYVMPYLPNGDLSTRDLRENEAAIVAILRALCRALGYAHNLGIVHRDVKPENVLFDKLDRPLLADFGIALAHQSARVTREGSTMGSSGYMSPEQARGHSLDGRADLYSLGVVTYEMLSGELPFTGPDTLAVALAHVEQPVPRLRPARQHWQAFIDRAMAKAPAERFQNAAQMEAALDLVAAVVGTADSTEYATRPMAALAGKRRSLRPYAGLSAAALLGISGIALITYALTRLRHAPSEIATVVTADTPTTPAVAGAVAGPAPAGPGRTSLTAMPVEASIASLNSETSAEDAHADDGTAITPIPQTPPAPLDVVPQAPRQAAPPRVADLPAGALLRDHGGPELAFVPARHARAGVRDEVSHAFALGRSEVTRREYAAFVRATGRDAARCRVPASPLSLLRKLSWREPGFSQDDNHPVVCVSWADAAAYAQWLGTRLHARYRLPTRSEWMHAAHWSAGAEGICSGNVADDKRAVLHRADDKACSDGFEYTAPVGQFKSNALGVRDLAGNVSEWTRDCKGGTQKTGDTGGGSCPQHFFVGTSWRDRASDHPPDFSESADADIGYTTIGFRVLRELDPNKPPPLVSPAAR